MCDPSIRSGILTTVELRDTVRLILPLCTKTGMLVRAGVHVTTCKPECMSSDCMPELKSSRILIILVCMHENDKGVQAKLIGMMLEFFIQTMVI